MYTYKKGREGGALRPAFEDKKKKKKGFIARHHNLAPVYHAGVHVLLCLITALWKKLGISDCVGIWCQYFNVLSSRYPVPK